jgi:MraZ protein
MKQWEKIEAIILKLNDYNDVASKVKRQLLSGATVLETDAAGRLLIPKAMLAYAGISKDIVFSAQINKMEIWDAVTHLKETTVDQADFKAMVGSVLGSNFLNPFDGE